MCTPMTTELVAYLDVSYNNSTNLRMAGSSFKVLLHVRENLLLLATF